MSVAATPVELDRSRIALRISSIFTVESSEMVATFAIAVSKSLAIFAVATPAATIGAVTYIDIDRPTFVMPLPMSFILFPAEIMAVPILLRRLVT